MAITTPDAVPGEVIEAAWGDAVRADLTALDSGKYAKTGGTISGDVIITGNTFLRGTTNRVSRVGSSRPGTEYYNSGETARQGAIIGADTGLELISDSGPVRLYPSGAEQMRIDASNLLVGHATAGMSNVGVEVNLAVGRLQSVIATANMNMYVNHATAADANGVAFVQFLRQTAVIGVISQVNTSGVAYGTTSDKRLKSFTRMVDPDEAVDKLLRVEPVQFTWRDAPGDGEQLGFFAQDLVSVAPEAVIVGSGEPGDEPDPDTGLGFVPWSVDHSKLVPTLVAAVQALTRRIETLEGAAA